MGLLMKNFFMLASAIIGGAAEAFELTVPGLNITFFQLLVGVLIFDVILSSVYIILGVSTDDSGTTVSKEVGLRNHHLKASKRSSHKTK